MRDVIDKAEKELVTIRALCDVLAVIEAAELKKNTLAAISALLCEAGERLFEYLEASV